MARYWSQGVWVEAPIELDMLREDRRSFVLQAIQAIRAEKFDETWEALLAEAPEDLARFIRTEKHVRKHTKPHQTPQDTKEQYGSNCQDRRPTKAPNEGTLQGV